MRASTLVGTILGASAVMAVTVAALPHASHSAGGQAPDVDGQAFMARPAPLAPGTSPFVLAPSSHPSFSGTPVQDFTIQDQMYPCPQYGYINMPEQNPNRSFYFTRGAYSEGMRFRGGSWSIDFPKADRQFLYVMERTLGWDIFPCENPISLADPHLRSFPFLYMLEVGRMQLSEAEIENFRSYLLAGGFAYIDDFWDTNEWSNWAREISKVLPEYEIVEIPADHMIFRIVYPIDEVLQVPSVGNGRGSNPAFYGECRYGNACTPTVRGIFDNDGRLMVLMTHNSDLGDAWEHAENPYYPFDRSNYAFSMAFNIIAYSMVY